MERTDPDVARARACPSCSEAMERHSLARKPAGRVDLDICFGCHAIWFDQYESAALTPGAILELFRTIHAHRDAPPRPLRQNSRCPACRGPLQLTHDIQRTNRITYYRCPQAHGRLTTFVQFLREKNFVRTMTAGEIGRLAAHVTQVRCSGCGGPVDLTRDAQCAYCRSPISVLDPDAVKKALAELDQMERRRTTVDPTAAMDALLAGKRFQRRLATIEGRLPAPLAPDSPWGDLVSEALGLLMQGDQR
jgi:ribosomal protein L31